MYLGRNVSAQDHLGQVHLGLYPSLTPSTPPPPPPGPGVVQGAWSDRRYYISYFKNRVKRTAR